MTTMTSAVDRFRDPLYTPAEAARYLGVPDSTFRTWARGTPVVTAFDRPRGHASVPFVGLAEAYTLRALRETGVPLQRIRPALAVLDRELGLEHALASQRLFTDGVEVLYDYSATSNDADVGSAARELVVVRDGQRVLHDVVERHLKRVVYGDGYAQVLPLPGYGHATVVADASRSFGQPIFASGAARVTDAISLFRAGERLDLVAEEFGIPELELEEVVRAALGHAA